MNPAGGFIYTSLEWVTRLAYANLLWGLFTLAGGIVFGLFPATTALFAITREWLKGNSDLPVFKTFWNFFKKEFFKSNLLGLFVAGMMVILLVDLWYIRLNADDTGQLVYIPLVIFIVSFSLFLLYIFPAFVHYDLKMRQVIKNAFLIMLVNPLHTFLMIVCLVSIFFVIRVVPALAFIFGASSYAFITMWLSYHAFNRTEEKQNKTTG